MAKLEIALSVKAEELFQPHGGGDVLTFNDYFTENLLTKREEMARQDMGERRSEFLGVDPNVRLGPAVPRNSSSIKYPFFEAKPVAITGKRDKPLTVHIDADKKWPSPFSSRISRDHKRDNIVNKPSEVVLSSGERMCLQHYIPVLVEQALSPMRRTRPNLEVRRILKAMFFHENMPLCIHELRRWIEEHTNKTP